MRLRLKPWHLGLTALVAIDLLAACSSAEKPTPAPSPTSEPALVSCGESGAHMEQPPLTAFSSQRDSFIWVLPDGTDANVSLDDIRASDPNASDSTAISFPLWSTPSISPDGLRSAITVLRRYSGSPDTRTVVVLSSADDPVLGTLVLPEGYVQALVTLNWLPDSGCLAVLVMEPTQAQKLFVLSANGEMITEFQPKLGRGGLLDATANGWIVLDRLTWDIPEIELFDIRNPGTTIIVASGVALPNFPGLPGDNMTAEQFVASLRD